MSEAELIAIPVHGFDDQTALANYDMGDSNELDWFQMDILDAMTDPKYGKLVYDRVELRPHPVLRIGAMAIITYWRSSQPDLSYHFRRRLEELRSVA